LSKANGSAPSSSGSLADLSAQGKAVVGFDTATADTTVCATRGGEILHEELLGLSPQGSPRHSTALLAEVERAVEACGGWDAVGGLAVGRGPGSFVGIRIGLATARGLAASTGVPAVGVCTLDALGWALSEAGDGETLAILDARRGEVFAALYAPGGERLWEPLVLAPESLGERVAQLPAPPRAAGSGAVRFRKELAARGIEIPEDADPVHHVAARQICALAADGVDESLEPIYLRPPDAQRWRERHDSQRAG
jgi:tRNA threonylcarbamoyladenosine biosynthesis protein TsaB